MGRSCSSFILHSGCICRGDSVAGTELFFLSNVVVLGKAIYLKVKEKKKSLLSAPPFLSAFPS